MRRAVVVAIVVVILAAAVGVWQIWGRPKQGGQAAQPAGGPPAVAVEAARVKVGTISREITAVGTMRSDESVMIRPEIAGRVARIAFNEGQRAAKGQLLVKLDDSTAAAVLEQAKANLILSQNNFERAERLFKQGAGTARARDEAEAKLRFDQAQIDVARSALEKSSIIAPFDGVLGLRIVSVGAYVIPGQDIVNLESIDLMKVDFRVPEIYLAAVREGQTVNVVADAFPGKSFPGAVYAINPLLDEVGRSIVIRARVGNTDHVLRPGLFVRLQLKIDEVEGALLVPEEALVPRGNDVLLYRIIDGKAVQTPVKTGKRRKGEVEITEGLTAEDSVVTAGQMKLRGAQTPVTVVGAKPGA